MTAATGASRLTLDADGLPRLATEPDPAPMATASAREAVWPDMVYTRHADTLDALYRG